MIPIPKGITIRPVTPVSRGPAVDAVLASDLCRYLQCSTVDTDVIVDWCRQYSAAYVYLTPGRSWEELAEGVVRRGMMRMVVELPLGAKSEEG